MILWLFTRIPCEIAPWCTEQLSGERHLNGYRIGRRIANTICGASWAKGYRANHRCTVRSRRFVEKIYKGSGLAPKIASVKANYQRGANVTINCRGNGL
jgi:hypothetical protein